MISIWTQIPFSPSYNAPHLIKSDGDQVPRPTSHTRPTSTHTRPHPPPVRVPCARVLITYGDRQTDVNRRTARRPPPGSYGSTCVVRAFAPRTLRGRWWLVSRLVVMCVQWLWQMPNFGDPVVMKQKHPKIIKFLTILRCVHRRLM